MKGTVSVINALYFILKVQQNRKYCPRICRMMLFYIVYICNFSVLFPLCLGAMFPPFVTIFLFYFLLALNHADVLGSLQ